MRLIDADALSAFVGDLRSTLHKEQSTFKAMTEIEFNTRDYMLLNFQQTIDNAPTVDPDVNCSHCDYFTFSRRFIKNVANFMADYKIETVEDLMTELNHINEWLGGKDNE